MKKSIFHFTFVLLLIVSQNFAQNTEEILGMSLEELLNYEIVSAGKKPEKVSEIPASVVIVTKEQIQKYGYRNIPEILENVPGLYKHNDWNLEGDNFGIRGFWSNQYNRNVVILVNGVSKKSDIYEFNMLSNINTPVEAIDKIEIVRGPMSLFYGSGAFFGVINIVTNQQAVEDESNQVSLSLGNEKTFKAFVSRKGKVSDIFYSFNASFNSTGGLNTDFSKVIDSIQTFSGGYTKNATTNDYLDKQQVNLDFSLNHNNFYALIQYDFTNTGYVAFAPPTYSNLDPYCEVRKMSAVVGYKLVLSNIVNIETKLSYNESQVYFDSQGLTPGLNYGMEQDPSKSYGIDILAFVHPEKKLEMTLGGSYLIKNDIFLFDDFTELGIHNQRHTSETPIKELAAFIRVKYSVSDDLILYGGLRGEIQGEYEMARKWIDENLNYKSVASTYNDDKIYLIPHMAIIYNLSHNNILKLLYGRSIVRPSFFENHEFYGVPHDKLVPQDITTYEINYLTQLNNYVNSNISLFYNRLNNLITRSITWENNSYISKLTNNSEMETIGSEIQLSAKLNKLSLDGALTTQFTKDLVNNIEAGYSPDLLCYLKISYIVNDNLSIAITGNYVSEMKAAWSNPPLPQISIFSTETPPIGRIAESSPSYINLGANLRISNIITEGDFLNIRFSNLLNKDIYYPATPNNEWFQKGTLDTGIKFLITAGVVFSY